MCIYMCAGGLRVPMRCFFVFSHLRKKLNDCILVRGVTRFPGNVSTTPSRMQSQRRVGKNCTFPKTNAYTTLYNKKQTNRKLLRTLLILCA